jgi:hypothetical protein
VTKHRRGGPGAQHVGVVDAVAAGHQRVQQRQNPAARPVMAWAVTEVDQLVDDRLDSQALSERGGQHEPSVGDCMVVVERDHKGVGTWEDDIEKVPSWSGGMTPEPRHSPCSEGLSHNRILPTTPEPRYIQASTLGCLLSPMLPSLLRRWLPSCDVTGSHQAGRGSGMGSMDSADRAALIIGLAFLLLVGVIFVTSLMTMSSVDDFLKVWTAVGPIVGVVVGSIPAHFFRSMAQDANEKMVNMANKMADAGK